MRPSASDQRANTALTGRINQNPSALVIEEVLRPQFEYELQHVLPGYLLIEQALLAEYVRLEILTPAAAQRIARLVAAITPEALQAHAAASMTDIAFAIETLVAGGLQPPVPLWHVDRSRNDLQACAQLMALRQQVLAIAGELLALIEAALALATRTTGIPMPGYTHYQAAEVISPGFYLAAMAEQMLQSCQQLLATYDLINASPLGAGAIAGQHLAWDRAQLARLLGFDRAQPHALVCVASREWALRVSAEIAILGTSLSRFATDLLLWGGSQHGFIDLPDQLAGISSAMPQKKNFPILERIRGRTAHMTALFTDLAMGQRSTPFTNLVEVSKEAGANLIHQLASARSTLRLCTLVLQHLEFREDRLLDACAAEFFGGFQLANTLALNHGIPYRRAQVLTGRFILALIQRGAAPCDADASLLTAICAAEGHTVTLDEPSLRAMFDSEQNLWSKQSTDSANPQAVELLLHDQQARYLSLRSSLDKHQSSLDVVPTLIQEALGLASD
jgi:argininosuccinate lyase